MNEFVAKHLEVMFGLHEAWCRRKGFEVPEELRVLVGILTDSVSVRQQPSPDLSALADLGDVADGASVPLAHDLDDAGRVLGGVSRSTVERMVRRGELRAVAVGGRTVVPRVELERLLAADVSDDEREAG